FLLHESAPMTQETLTLPLCSRQSVLGRLLSRLAVLSLLSLNDLLNLFHSLTSFSLPSRCPNFRPSLEGLEARWCPAIYRWNAAAASNWSTQGNWQKWIPGNPGQWQNSNQIPTSADTAQFDGTSTKLCTVSSPQSVVELDISVGGGGFDQIMVGAGQNLEAKFVWSVNNVQIGFGDSVSALI